METILQRPILNRVNSVYIEPDLLCSLYWGNCYTRQQIGNIFGCSDVTIGNRLKKYGISCRIGGCIVTDFTFNDIQKEIFEGCMLGDGSLMWATNYCYFTNGDIHEEYLFWLQKQLGVEDISKVEPVYTDGFAYHYRLRTGVIPSIRDEYKRWYPNGKGTRSNYNHKIVPKDIEMTPIELLFWYIGDGSYSKRDKTTYFGNCLVYDDWLPLLKKISKVLGVDSGIYIWKSRKDNDGIQNYNLHLNNVVTNKFFDMVDSLDFDIPKCYHYKFGK